MKLLRNFSFKWFLGVLILLPFIFFYIILNNANDAENRSLISIEQNGKNCIGNVTITINEIKKDYLYSDITLKCPKRKFDYFTISTDTIIGVRVDTIRNTVKVKGIIDIFKSESFRLDSTFIRNEINDNAIYQFTNKKILIPIKSYASPISSIGANIHLNLNTKNDKIRYTIESLTIRNLDKNQRIEILSNDAYINNSNKSEIYKVFSKERFNRSFYLKISPNQEFVDILTTLLFVVIGLLLSVHIYLVVSKNVTIEFFGLAFTVTLGIVSLISFFHDKITGTKSISELIVFIIYFWIATILLHSVILMFLQQWKKQKQD